MSNYARTFWNQLLIRNISLLIGLSLLVSPGIIGAADWSTEKQVCDLQQTALYWFWNGGDLKKAEKEFFKGITLQGNMSVIEQCFLQAALLAPERTDLQFDLASTLVLENRLTDALPLYRNMLINDKRNFDAALLLAAYDRALQRDIEYAQMIQQLQAIDTLQAALYQKALDRTEACLTMPVVVSVDSINPGDAQAIVTLGYALADDGTMRPPLYGRLNVTLTLAKLFPKSKIIVSGGVPRGGVTESFLMTEWLVSKGIDRNRILIEDKSKDTVANANFSVDILAKNNLTRAVIVSSASHVRRAQAVFTETARSKGHTMTFTHCAFNDYDSVLQAQAVGCPERIVVYRDSIRAAGLWAYPGLQQ